MLAIKPNFFLKVIIFMMITLESASILLSASEIDQMSYSGSVDRFKKTGKL
jgi:hypothetical protein